MAMRVIRSGAGVVLLMSLILAACEGGAGGEGGESGAAMPDEPADDPDALVGSWLLVSITQGEGTELVPPGEAEPMLEFTAEADPTGSRRFGGSGGCNRIMGGYDAGRTGRLAIGRGPAMTMMACPEPVMSLEQAFLAALESASSYRIDGDRLTIGFDGGELHLQRTRS
jgi:heat shock protein HslJ